MQLLGPACPKLGSTVATVFRSSRSSRPSGGIRLRDGGLGRPVMAVVALVIALGVVVAPISMADDLNSRKQHVDAEVDDAQSEVLAFNKKVARATRQVLNAREQLPAAQRNLDKALAARVKAERQRKKAAEDLAQAKSDVLSAERKLARIERRIATLRENVGDFARRAYQMGPFARLEMLLDANDPSDFTDRLAAIRSVSRANNDSLEEMNGTRADLLDLEIELAALRKAATKKKSIAELQLQAAKDAAAGALTAQQLVAALVSQEKSALSVAKENRADIKSQYEDLAKEQARIQEEIAAAARKLARQTGIRTDSSGGSAIWQWPLPGGSIGSEAGWRVHPILGYVRCHTGVDISAPSGTGITAVDDGVVISAGDGGAFGNYTVISHGGSLTSSYAHQSNIAVSAGQAVKRGQVIGFVGSTGWSTGPHLHLEARIAGIPWDPRGWFSSGEKVPVCL
jgi:murein DD-endopeptidase MepM/ murein hydrolase activator NlpD